MTDTIEKIAPTLDDKLVAAHGDEAAAQAAHDNAKVFEAQTRASVLEHRGEADRHVANNDPKNAAAASRAAAAAGELADSAGRVVAVRKRDLEAATQARKVAAFYVADEKSKLAELERQAVLDKERATVSSIVADSLRRVTEAAQKAADARADLDTARHAANGNVQAPQFSSDMISLPQRSIHVLAQAMPAEIKRALSRI
jgi:hypothetical protein